MYKEGLKSKFSLDDLDAFFRNLAYHGVEHPNIISLRKEKNFKWMTVISRLIRIYNLMPDDVFSDIYYNILGKYGMDFGHIKFLLRSEYWQIRGAMKTEFDGEAVLKGFSISAHRTIGRPPKEKHFRINVNASNNNGSGLFKNVNVVITEHLHLRR